MTKYNKHTIFLAVIFLFASFEGKAQKSTSLNEFKQKALEHNQTVKAKEANYIAGEASLELSKRASLPNLDFDASYLYQNDPMLMDVPGYELPHLDGTPSGVLSPASTKNLSYHNTYSANMGIGLPLYLGGKFSYARKIAANATAIAESDVALSQTNVLLSIEQQYWTLVSLLEFDKVNQKSIVFLNDVVKDMNNRYETGLVTKNEVLRTKVELNNAKLNQLSINDDIELSKMAFNQSIGMGINEPLHIADTAIEILVDLTTIEGIKPNLDKRQEIRMLTKQTEIYELENKIVNADYMPQLVSFANYRYQNPNHLAQDEGEFTWNAGVSLSIPVFHWGERNLKKSKAKMKIVSAQYQLDQTKEMLTLEIHQSIFKLKESMTKLQFTFEALEQAQENLTLESNLLHEQITTSTDLLNAQLQWQKAQADYISAKANVKISEAIYKNPLHKLIFKKG